MKEVFLYRVMSCRNEELKAATVVGCQFILLIRLKCFLWNVKNLPDLRRIETSDFMITAASVCRKETPHIVTMGTQSEQQSHSVINDSQCLSRGPWWHHRCSCRKYGITFEWLWKQSMKWLWKHLFFPPFNAKTACVGTRLQDVVRPSHEH